jgi:hypothetical protein
MSIPDDKLSVTPVTAAWLPPDELFRLPNEDYEAGPVAISDTTKGLHHQVWHLTYDSGTGNLQVTPENTGIPITIITVAGVTQCTFAFDQNGDVTIAYTAGGLPFMYWYDTDVPAWVTTQLVDGAITPTVCLDDKRTTQTNSSDILLFYTIEDTPGVYTLYSREQRDRFTDETLLKVGTRPYLRKLGMHKELRVQIGLSNTVI